MTREEAIHELQEDKKLYETEVCHAGDGSPDGRLLEALDMAIEALSADAIESISENTIVVKYADYEDIGRIILTNGDIFCKIFYEDARQNDDSDYDSLVPDEYKTEPSDLISRADAICEVLVNDGIDNIVDRINALPSAELPKGDLISRAEAIEAVCREICDTSRDKCETIADGNCGIVQRIDALPSSDRPTEDYSDLPDIPRAYYEKIVGNMSHEINMLKEQLESADAEQIVIRAKIFMRKEDFDKWAEDIKKQNKSIVCIPCDAEVVSADRPSGEWIEKGGELVCSVCGNSVSFSRTPKGWVLGKFCQSCGARMIPYKGGDDE